MKTLLNTIKSDQKLLWFSILMLVVFFFTGFYLIFSFPALGDEKNFHLPTLLSFYHQPTFSAIFSNSYHAANTPLPYLILRLVFPFSPPGIVGVRICSLIFSILSILLILKIFKELKAPDNAYWFIPIMVFYPYFLKSSFTFYMAVYGMFWFLLSLLILIKKDKRSMDYLGAGLFSALAILSQQFYFAWASAMFVYIL